MATNLAPRPPLYRVRYRPFPAGALLRAAARAVSQGAIRLADHLADASARAAQRRRLVELSDQHLRDIAVSRADAWAEYRKPWWRR